MTALRIGVLCYPTFGGSGVLATQLAVSLADLGHQVHLLSYATPSRLPAFTSRLCFHQVEVSSYPLFKYPSYDLALAAKIVEIASEQGLDLIHAHYAIPHSISAILAADVHEDPPLKVITTLHGTDITLLGSEENYGPMIRYALKHSDAVTAVSEYLAAESRATCCKDSDIEVIPNFVDLDEFSRLELSADLHDPPTFVHISNFRPVKRTHFIVEAFAKIRKQSPCRLLMVGEGPDLAQTKALVRSLNVCDDVDFLGQQTDVASILRSADVFLLTSETESFGLSALEAMASGVPAVCMNVGGLGEVIEHGHSGLLTPDGDIDSMASACLSLLEHPDLFPTWRRRARARAEMFSKDSIVERYATLYRRLLNDD